MPNKSFIKQLICCLLIIFVSCNPTGSDKAGKVTGKFLSLSANETNVHFNNVIEDTKQNNALDYDYYYNGAGVATADFNNDGLIDLFFTGNSVHDSLYINKGNFQFDNQTLKANITDDYGWSTGVTVVDINNDGWNDIYVCKAGNVKEPQHRKNKFYINNGDGTFTNKANKMGLADERWSVQASFFDYDKDGDLDIFLLNHSPELKPIENMKLVAKDFVADNEKVYPNSCALYQNQGNAQFTEVTENAGLLKPAFGLGVLTTDFNNDGWIDIYVANDFFIPDCMYINNGDGSFSDKIKETTNHIPFYSMGCDAADINNDGFVDLATLDMAPEDHIRSKTLMESMNPDNFKFHTQVVGSHKQYMYNSLYANDGSGFFYDFAHFAGYAKTDWSWATLLADFDNDGLKDIYVTNGFRRDSKDNDWKKKITELRNKKGGKLSQQDKLDLLEQCKSTPIKNYAFKNKGEYEFEKFSDNWGLTDLTFSNGCAYADLDNDGDLDIVVNNINSEALIYVNQVSSNNYLQVQLKSGSNKPLINSQVEIYYNNGEKQLQELIVSRGYQSSVSNLLHFGLGNVTKIDSINIIWNDGSYQQLIGIDANQRLTIEKKAAKKYSPSAIKPLFTDFTNPQGFQHRENPFNDFKKEILLPYKQSQTGPALAVADVNKDGFDDFFIGGAYNQSGSLITIDENGTFIPTIEQPWDNHVEYEDVAALFFDADGDTDEDLYVVSGGGEFIPNSVALQDRLYINRGNGMFQYFPNALPDTRSNGSCITSIDFDKDGDIDLFIGARAIPGQYPMPDRSVLLRNDKTHYTDVTEQYLPNDGKIGVVTDATWADLNNDNKLELIVVGEWMEVTILELNDNQLKNVTQNFGLQNFKGIWQAVKAHDFDKDGDIDLLVGNLGKNNKFKASTEKPFHLYYNDFDENGNGDIVLSGYYKNKQVPVRGKECSTQQMPFLADKYETYIDFASSDLTSIYGVDKLNKSYHLEVNTFYSYFLENDNGNFKKHKLPNKLQLFPINSFEIIDVDNDEFIDIICAGNLFETEVETTPFDAGVGQILTVKKDGNFDVISSEKSGLQFNKNVKNISLLTVGNQKYKALLVANNNDVIQFYVLLPN